MTPAQFARAVEVAGVSPSTPATHAAAAVLLRDIRPATAARMHQIDRAAVHRAVKRIEAAAKACPCCGRAF